MTDKRELDLEFHASEKEVRPRSVFALYHFGGWLKDEFVTYATSFVGFHIAMYIVFMFVWGTVIYIIENNGHPNSNLYDISPCSNSTPPVPGAPLCGPPVQGIFYVDALFLGLSAISASGLLTVDFSAVTLATQASFF